MGFAGDRPNLRRTTKNCAPGKCGGRPCIRGMRIRVSDILEMLGLGVSPDEIMADFPDLEPEDLNACLLFAAKLPDITKSRSDTN
ncbi:MAG: DUF433 domain-containing protein [Hormoscilla sp. GM102CHS1]|nr:DUF433 domain-containing protein [Hormoscilla sp. GM102CHS1]